MGVDNFLRSLGNFGGALPQQLPVTAVEEQARQLRASVTATIDGNGNPTAAYWQMLGVDARRQTTGIESIRRMMLFFTVLAVLELVGAAIWFIAVVVMAAS